MIPPKRGRSTTKKPKGYWRRVMATRFDKQKYGQRWQVETVNSMIKQMLDSALRARRYWSQHREIMLRVVKHNLKILRRKVFYRAVLTLFSSFSFCSLQ
ncbi:transposase [Bythopirellula polymerisocia]|uniref:transposase n=1 Tax=Bythopirellula polymerisocia TaxID=2528003 RepID=UPI0037039A4E